MISTAVTMKTVLRARQAALFVGSLAFLAGCSSTPQRPPPGEQEAFIVIGVPRVASVASEKKSYDCDGLSVRVEYINAGDSSLAVLEFDEEFVVASNVLSGSGARYAGKQYIWWVKGEEAQFENLMADDPQPRQCQITS
jgi:membrane-bound inhibitor of C-type lysozyme